VTQSGHDDWRRPLCRGSGVVPAGRRAGWARADGAAGMHDLDPQETGRFVLTGGPPAGRIASLASVARVLTL